MSKILIIGANLYGCYISLLLKILKVPFLLLEKGDAINDNLLLNNCYKFETEYNDQETNEFQDMFFSLFGLLVETKNENYYIIKKNNSNSGSKKLLNFNNFLLNFNSIDTVIKKKDTVINLEKFQKYFELLLAGCVVLNYNDDKLIINGEKIIYDGIEFSYLVNCMCDKNNCAVVDLDVDYVEHIVAEYNIKNDQREGSQFINSLTIYGQNKICISKPFCDSKYFITTNGNGLNEMQDEIKECICNFDSVFEYKGHRVYTVPELVSKDIEMVDSFKFYRTNNVFSFVTSSVNNLFKVAMLLMNEILELNRLNGIYTMKSNETENLIRTILSVFERTVTRTESLYHTYSGESKTLFEFLNQIVKSAEFVGMMKPKLKKIAVLFFGYTRNLHKNFQHHRKLLELGDVFVHTYDTPGMKSRRAETWLDQDSLRSGIDVDFITKHYRPKDLVVAKNNLNSFSINDGHVIPLFAAQAKDDATKYINSQLYTRQQVCLLKRNFERRHEFRYDVILLVRFDFGVANIGSILNLDMNNVYFPGRLSGHVHPGGGGGCLTCDKGNFHRGRKHTNDFCDVWCMSSSENMDFICDLYSKARDILYATRNHTHNYVVSHKIKHDLIGNFLYIFNSIENENIICYYPERLLREYLVNLICLSCDEISGSIVF